MKMIIGGVLTAVLFATAGLADSESSVNNAYGLCRVFDNTGMLSEPCDVSGWNSSVDVKMDTNGAEARSICRGVVDMMRDSDVSFDPGWKVRIYSPYSGENTLAQCNL